MAKKKDSIPVDVKVVQTLPEGEQLDLIDVAPENAKPIIAKARIYQKAKIARINCGHKEDKLKAEFLSIIREAKIPTLEGGVIKFRCDGVLITVTPRDELITVKDEADET